MIRQAHDAGVAAALARYGVKEAAIPWGKVWGGAKNVLNQGRKILIGEPEHLLQGRKAFQGEGPFSAKNIFWPTHHDPTTKKFQPVATWMGRGFNTLLPAYGVYQAATGQGGDPNEGRLTNALSALGQGLGGAYGYGIGGMIGGGLGANTGASAGAGLGRMLGSRPKGQQMQPQMAQSAYDEMQPPMNSPGGY